MSFNTLLQELFLHWWFGGLVLPAFISMCVGFPISIYTGWIISRAIQFQSEAQRALEELMTYPSILQGVLDLERRTSVELRTVNALLNPVMALVAQEQYAAAAKLAAISSRLEAVTLDCWEAAQKSAVENSPTVKMQIDRFDSVHRAAVQSVRKMRPCWPRVIGLPILSRTIWRLKRGAVRGRRIQRYLNGQGD